MSAKERGRIIEVKAGIFADNEARAARLRAALAAGGVLLLDVLGSPGAGKTSLIEALLARLAPGRRAAVIEADLESRVDADRLEAGGHRAVQLRTGGMCHLDAAMTEAGLAELGLPGPADKAGLDLVFLENVGNLICTAQVDSGASLRLVLLSVPEGDDKPRKYPPIFAAADAVAVTKVDYLDREAFDLAGFRDLVRGLNPRAPVFAVSARSGEGLEELSRWLEAEIRELGARGSRS